MVEKSGVWIIDIGAEKTKAVWFENLVISLQEKYLVASIEKVQRQDDIKFLFQKFDDHLKLLELLKYRIAVVLIFLGSSFVQAEKIRRYSWLRQLFLLDKQEDLLTGRPPTALIIPEGYENSFSHLSDSHLVNALITDNSLKSTRDLVALVRTMELFPDIKIG